MARQVALVLVNVRKPSLVPDNVKAARLRVVEEAVHMAAALTVHDALRRYLAVRHRHEALEKEGAAAKSLLCRPPPRPLMLQVPENQVQVTDMCPTESSSMPIDEACWGVGRSAPSGLTASRGLVGGSSTFSESDGDGMFSTEAQTAAIHAELAQSAWMLGGRAVTVSGDTKGDSPAAVRQTAGKMEALDLATRRLPPVVRRKGTQRPKARYAPAKP